MKLTALLTAAALVAGTVAAQAVSVSVNTFTPTPVAPADSVLPVPTTTGDFRTLIGNDFDGTPPEARTPWEGTPFENTAEYFSLAGSTGLSTATYDFGGDISRFAIIWGSPDFYNQVQLFDDGNLVHTITGDEVAALAGITEGLGMANVTFFGTFDQVVFATTEEIDAFEYAEVAPIPLPAAGFMLLGALGLMGYTARRKAKA